MTSSTTCEVSMSSADHLAGDVVRATITFKGKDSQIDWAAVQFHGHGHHDPQLAQPCILMDPNIVVPTPLSSSSSNNNNNTTKIFLPTSGNNNKKKTAMPDMSKWVEGSTCLFASATHCLGADLSLSANDDHCLSFLCEFQLPWLLPPSFRGISTRYAYILTVCAKVRNEEFARVVHLPLYVSGVRSSNGDAARSGNPSAYFLHLLSKSSRTPLHNNNNSVLDLQGVNYFHPILDLPVFSIRVDQEREGEEDVEVAAEEDEEEEEEKGEEANNKLLYNAQTSQGKLARCVIYPARIRVGDTLRLKVDFFSVVEDVVVSLEVEENLSGPPPLVAAFEPLVVKRNTSPPWIKVINTRRIHVSLTSQVQISLSTLGACANFSTDIVFVHSFLRIAFHAGDEAVHTLRVPLNLQPNLHSSAKWQYSSMVQRLESRLRKSSHDGSFFESQSPPPTPKKLVVF